MSIVDMTPEFLRRRPRPARPMPSNHPRNLDEDRLRAVANAVDGPHYDEPTIASVSASILAAHDDIKGWVALIRARLMDIPSQEALLTQLIGEKRDEIAGVMATVDEAEKLITRVGEEKSGD